MAQTLRIPAALRRLAHNQDTVEVHAATVQEAMDELHARFPGIRERLLDESGALRRYINVYVNQEDIRFLQNQQTPLHDGDEISIIAAIAGG